MTKTSDLFEFKYKERPGFKLVGHIVFHRYSVPLVVIKPFMTNVRNAYNDLEFCARQKPNGDIDDACILIGQYIYDNMQIDDILNICYHEIAHILYPFYFDEYHADEFAVAHIGADAFIKSLSRSDQLVNDYFKLCESEGIQIIDDIRPFMLMSMDGPRYERLHSIAKRITITKSRKIRFVPL